MVILLREPSAIGFGLTRLYRVQRMILDSDNLCTIQGHRIDKRIDQVRALILYRFGRMPKLGHILPSLIFS